MSLSLERLVARLGVRVPLSLAEPWDNVGLLLEPRPAATVQVRRALLTVELSDAVVAEIEATRPELVVSYHPVLFKAPRRLTQAEAESRWLLRLLAAGAALYSPHTAADAVAGGVNDWLVEPLLDARSHVEPITPAVADPTAGAGRLVRLAQPLALGAAVAALKRHLGLTAARLATPAAADAPLRTVAACAGAGGGVFESLPTSGDGRPDLLVTGELRHHDVRRWVACGAAVLLCDHTPTERGWLSRLAAELSSDGELEVIVSRADREPLAPC